METLQINSISAEEFQSIIQKTVEEATTKAVEKALRQKEDLNGDITVAEIATLWGVKKRTVSKRITDHKVPTAKLGREIAIKRRFLETIKHPIRKEK